MARDAENKYRYGGGRVDGSLAYDFDYEERTRRGAEIRRREEKRRAPQNAPRTQEKAAPVRRTRAKQKLSPVLMLGFAALAGMLIVLLMSCAQLTEISNHVVSMQNELSTLEEEHVKLLASYEKTFDLATIKEAAEAAGMSKPSASQIYYVDLSAPDNVTVYQQQHTTALSRLLTSFGHMAGDVVEYFR